MAFAYISDDQTKRNGVRRQNAVLQTSNKLLLFVAEPMSDLDRKALDALRQLDPTVKVLVADNPAECTPLLDAISYDRSVYEGLEGVLGFIAQEKRARHLP